MCLKNYIVKGKCSLINPKETGSNTGQNKLWLELDHPNRPVEARWSIQCVSVLIVLLGSTTEIDHGSNHARSSVHPAKLLPVLAGMTTGIDQARNHD